MQLFSYLHRFIEILLEFAVLVFNFKIKLNNNNKENLQKKAILLKQSFEKLGSVFIKFGQLLALRPDLIPKEYCHELFYLLEDVAPMNKYAVNQVFKEELGKLPTEVFKLFKYKPIGSASFGQVHEAYLSNDEKLAVKIQRPNLEEAIKRDIKLMKFFAFVIDTMSLNSNKIMNFVKEFEMWTKEEIDYLQEAKYTMSFYNLIKDRHNTIKSPKIYEKYTTKKIIAQEFIEGFTLNKYLLARRTKDKAFLRKAGEMNFSEKDVANKLLLEGIKQIYLDGLFHADPHPANIIFSKNKELYYIDFGIVGTLTKNQRFHHLRYTRSCILGDVETAFKELIKFCEINTNQKNVDKLKEEHEKLVNNVLKSTKNKKIVTPELGIFLIDVLKLIKKYRLKVPKDRLRYFRTIITLQSVVFELHPQIEMDEVNKKFMRISILNLIESLPKLIEQGSIEKYILKWINTIEEEID